MLENSKFASKEILNQGLKEIEVKRKNIDITKALRKEIVDSYRKILAEARKKLTLQTATTSRLVIRELQAGKSTRVG